MDRNMAEKWSWLAGLTSVWTDDFAVIIRGFRMMIRDYVGTGDGIQAVMAQQQQNLFGLSFALALYRDGKAHGYITPE